MLSEAHAFGRETIEHGSFNLGLAVATQLGVTQVVGKNVDNVGAALPGVGRTLVWSMRQSPGRWQELG